MSANRADEADGDLMPASAPRLFTDEPPAAAVAPGAVDGKKKRWRATAGSGYLTRLLVTPQPDGRTWVTMAPFRWRDDGGNVHAVPRYFQTDFASVPVTLPTIAAQILTGLSGLYFGGWWFWIVGIAIGTAVGLAGFLPYGKHQWAAVGHDYQYTFHEMSRADADWLFFCMMRDTGTLFAKRWAMYLAVRAFGWISWRQAAGQQAVRVLSGPPDLWQRLPSRGVDRMLLRLIGIRRRA